MNKAQLIETIADKLDANKKSVGDIVNEMTFTIEQALSQGDEVSIAGFGTFKANKRAARTGRNPSTGASIEIAASTVPAFKAALALKKAVNS
ncbi:MAG: HU family DNA-binding protein [Dokdonella sp.]